MRTLFTFVLFGFLHALSAQIITVNGTSFNCDSATIKWLDLKNSKLKFRTTTPLNLDLKVVEKNPNPKTLFSGKIQSEPLSTNLKKEQSGLFRLEMNPISEIDTLHEYQLLVNDKRVATIIKIKPSIDTSTKGKKAKYSLNFTGNPGVDALLYSENAGTKNKSMLYRAYGIKQDSSERFIGENEFLKKTIAGFGPLQGPHVGSILGTAAGKIMNQDITTIAQGVTQFMLSRAKTELYLTFVQQFKDDLAKYPELGVLFPQTKSALENFSATEVYQLLPLFKEAFETDLRELPMGVVNLRDLTPGKKCATTDVACSSRINEINTLFSKPGGKAVITALLATHRLIEGDNPAEMLNNLVADKLFTDVDSGKPTKGDFENSVRLIRILSESLRSGNDTTLWMSKADVKKLVEDELAFKLYVGLTIQKYSKDMDKIAGLDLATLASKLVNSEESLRKAASLLQALVRDGEQINTQVKLIYKARKEDKLPSLQVMAGIGANTANLVKSGTELVKFLVPNSKLIPDPTLRNRAKVDSAALVNALNKLSNQMVQFKNLFGSMQSGNYGLVALNSVAAFNSIVHPNDSISGGTMKVTKYISFIALVAQAKDGDEVEKAIENVVLPPGSSVTKQESIFSVAVNGYVGAGWSFNSRDYFSDGKFMRKTAGAWLPIGISASWSTYSARKTPDRASESTSRPLIGALTLFASVVDLGSVAQFNLSGHGEDTLYALPKLTLQNIISPGLHIILSRLGNTPLALSAGVQYGPGIFSGLKSDMRVNDGYWRFNLGLSVDIPFFNLYTRPKSTSLY